LQNLPSTASLLIRGLNERQHLGGQIFVSLGGEILADESFGESVPGRLLKPDDLLLWLSSSKPITAIAVAQQHERKTLRWDDPVIRFIPEFGQNGKESITVRHLLTHTAGFRSADRIRDELPWPETIAQICAAPLEPGWNPGERAGYQIVSSWFILGEIVRRLDGRPFDLYLREEIFLPLGMNDSWIGMPPEAYRRYGDRIAPMYATDIGQPRPVSLWNSEKGCAICRPASNGRGAIRQLGLLYQWLLHPESRSLLKPQTVKELIKRHRVGLFDHTFQHVIDWGLGFIINSNRWGIETVPYAYGRYASPDTFGHSGAQSSCAFADPASELVVAWALNGMPGERAHQKRNREINSAIYHDLKLAGTA
jgi:CubicO group peptidase (beta-lactamase class C family)